MRLVGGALVFAGIVWGAVGAAGPAAAQESVGYVTAITGRVVALSSGSPILLNALDPVSDRTRLDLQANSEVQICHHATQRIHVLKGPSRASVSAGGVTVEAGKPVERSREACAAPAASTRQGGILARGVAADEGPELRRNFLGK